MTNTNKEKMNFVSNRLNLPLFLSARNRMKNYHPHAVPTYIAKKRNLYASRCNEEYKIETATTRRGRHLAGFYPHNYAECSKTRMPKGTRDLIIKKPWQLPPNLYEVLREPFSERKGLSGAYWRKLPKPKPQGRALTNKEEQKRRNERKGVWRFYNAMPEVLDRWSHTCCKYKGIFVTNARKRRATSRSMICNPLTCYHDPNDPGSAHYYSHAHEMGYNLDPVRKSKPLNPHIFLRNSCVPARRSYIVRPHISFEPGPGRYETRYPRVCACVRRKIYMPGLHLLIDREKRKKFRRQPYVKIKMRKYCSPDWQHVPGHGHRYLFKINKNKLKRTVQASKEVKKAEKAVLLYSDAKYIAMINNPARTPFSIRSEPMPELPTPVRYNCIAKRIMRRQLRNNKKIVFNSGQERFPDSDWRPTVLTVSQLEKLKSKLPLDRQFRDYPVMRKSPSQIIGKLYETPDHMKPSYELSLRKRLFKFLPLPGPKVLVTEKDTHPEMPDGGPYVPQCYFGKELDVHKFYKSDVSKRNLQQTVSSGSNT